MATVMAAASQAAARLVGVETAVACSVGLAGMRATPEGPVEDRAARAGVRRAAEERVARAAVVRAAVAKREKACRGVDGTEAATAAMVGGAALAPVMAVARLEGTGRVVAATVVVV